MKNARKSYTRLDNYAPPPWLVGEVYLEFELDLEATYVFSRLKLYRNLPDRSELKLDGEELELLEIKINGKQLPGELYQTDESGLTVMGEHGDEVILETKVKINPAANTRLEGLYTSAGIFCTQCEAQGFRRITWFPDRPDVMAVFTVKIIAAKEKYPVLLSNGNLIEEQDLNDGRHMALWADPFPKPSYLFALVAGKLAVTAGDFQTCSGRKISLNIYSEPHNSHLCGFALKSLKQAMRWDEEIYGLEYDLDRYNIVAVDDFNSGAMENKSLNIFNSRYVLASPDTATDNDFLNIQSVIAHEYFHNYSGNRVTCRDWFQLSLKEGLTVFRDQQFSADLNSALVKRIQDVSFLRTYQFPEAESALAHPVRPDKYIEIRNFYTVTVYEKGAEIMRMIYVMLGTELWRKTMDLYFSRFDGQAVRVEDLLECAKEAGEDNYIDMLPWYKTAETPVLSASWNYEDGGMKLVLKQEGTVLPMPVKLSWISEHENFKPQTVIFAQSEAEYNYPAVAKNAVPSLLQDFSAPVKLKADYSREDLALLIRRDNDGFNRWDAMQKLAFSSIFAGGLQKLLEVYQFLLAEINNSSRVDHGFYAEMLTFPDISVLIADSPQVDIDDLTANYLAIKKQIADELFADLAGIYARLNQSEKGLFTSEEIARRKLKNTALAMMGAEACDIAYRQYAASSNMTDMVTAIKIILNFEHKTAGQILAGFYQQWNKTPLVLDKWFSLQAQAERKNVFAKVQNLALHPDFNYANPNRARSLLAVFAVNPIGLHCGGEEAYAFLSNWILKLDQINPQIAARLCKAFAVYPKLDDKRRQAVIAILENMLSRLISADLYEVVQNLVDID